MFEGADTAATAVATPLAQACEIRNSSCAACELRYNELASAEAYASSSCQQLSSVSSALLFGDCKLRLLPAVLTQSCTASLSSLSLKFLFDDTRSCVEAAWTCALQSDGSFCLSACFKTGQPVLRQPLFERRPGSCRGDWLEACARGRLSQAEAVLLQLSSSSPATFESSYLQIWT